jgi:hypothetical protein
MDLNGNILSRRDMLRSASCGFGYLALSALLSQSARANTTTQLAPKIPTLPARAKRVIFLCMAGGPAHLDTFDYKPQLTNAAHPGSVFDFKRHGDSGLWISELLPQTARHADKLCVINGMHADTGNHAQSFNQLHTGDLLRRRPSMGSWITYGLGTENQNLPGLISLNTSKPATYSSAFLPPAYEGTPIGINGEDMSKASIPNIGSKHLSPALKRRQLDLVQAMNREHRENRPYDVKLESVIQSMEMGFCMQAIAPKLLDVSTESKKTLERYQVGSKKTVGTCRASDFGRQCLIARRLSEAGVRFIELNHGSWDQHKWYRRDLRANCETTDAPIAALLDDLEARGLLDETLVVWGGEFGRPGLTPGNGKDETGHNARGFTFWLAGGGTKRGYVHGRTNDTGSAAVDGKVHFHDLHATLLHLMGLKHDQLTFHHGGRDHRLTGPNTAKIATGIIA